MFLCKQSAQKPYVAIECANMRHQDEISSKTSKGDSNYEIASPPRHVLTSMKYCKKSNFLIVG